MVVIKQEGFILRPLTVDDAPGYFETMQDTDTQKNLETYPKTIEETQQEIKENLQQGIEKDSLYFTIEVSEEYAGNVILQHQNWDPSNNEGRVHMWIHPAFRKKGLGYRALLAVIEYGFSTKFVKIFAQCKVHNLGVMKIIQKLGFHEVKRFLNDKQEEKVLWVKTK